MIFLICLSSSDFSSSSVDPHTVSAARHRITSWWGVCLLRAGYEFFIFMPSKFPSLPCSPNYLLFYASVFLLIFSPWSVFHLPIYFVSPRDAVDFISLFRDGGDNPPRSAGTKVVVKISDKHGDWGASRCGCLCFNMRYSEFLKFERHFTGKKNMTPFHRTHKHMQRAW